MHRPGAGQYQRDIDERPNAPEARQAGLLALLIGYELTGFREISTG
jgi:hypothetical protein